MFVGKANIRGHQVYLASWASALVLGRRGCCGFSCLFGVKITVIVAWGEGEDALQTSLPGCPGPKGCDLSAFVALIRKGMMSLFRNILFLFVAALRTAFTAFTPFYSLFIETDKVNDPFKLSISAVIDDKNSCVNVIHITLNYDNTTLKKYECAKLYCFINLF